jgi:hypothetical protein
LIGLNLNPPRPGIQRVLNQLLDRTGRTLHHLASSDAIDGLIGKAMNGHERSLV